MSKITVSEGDTTMSTEKSSYRIGYARVSTLEQDEALQHDALTAAGCERVFVDRVSGKLEHRPALDAMLDQLRPGDSVTVWRLDRLGRSLRHLIDVVADLEARGVAFRSLMESLDTSTPGGKLTFHLFGALAEFERDLIRERTMAGLAAARVRGRKGGRPTVWTAEKVRLALEMYDKRQHDVAGIARILGVSRASVYRAIADRGKPGAEASASGTRI
jgi:DNA invertase Pin-like site-specific DNA recombinase